jgi:hypothetical protein
MNTLPLLFGRLEAWMGGWLRVILRICGTLCGLLAVYCGFWANNQWKQEAVARQLGDQTGEAVHSESAAESLRAGLVFGGVSVGLWMTSFLLRRRSEAMHGRQPSSGSMACPHCGFTLPVTASFCRNCQTWLK